MTTLASAQVTVSSPDGLVRMTITGGERLNYAVTYRGKPVIAPSTMGLEIQGQAPLGLNMNLGEPKTGKIDETYTVPAGKSSSIRNQCNTVTVEAIENARTLTKLREVAIILGALELREG